MSNYDDLLEEARAKAEAFRSSAREYIPEMYDALRIENPNISPEDARDKIEKDCIGIWSKSTILHALPDEAKNKEKQKAGRLRQKERNSAAFSAAPTVDQEEKKKIVVAAIQGKSVEEDMPLSSAINTNNDSLSEDNTANSNSIHAHLPNQKTVSELKECSSCQELQEENIELREALQRATKLTTADQINKPSSSDKDIQLENSSSNILHFEFSLSVEDVRQYIVRRHKANKSKDKLWFSGAIDKSTGKVLTATTGKKSRQTGIEDMSKTLASLASSFLQDHRNVL